MSNSAVIKRHPWVLPVRKQAHPKLSRRLTDPSPPPVGVPLQPSLSKARSKPANPSPVLPSTLHSLLFSF